MLTPKISGIFDVRDYDGKTKDRQARRMKADTDNIVFSSVFAKSELPDQFKVNGAPDTLLRQRSSRAEKQAAEATGREPELDMYVVPFKISPTTSWFDRHGKTCSRPTNEELEASKWDVQIDFVRREKDPLNPLKPSGYWVNAIMISKREENPFEGQEFEPIAAEPEPTKEAVEEAEAKLPF